LETDKSLKKCIEHTLHSSLQ